MNKNGKISIYYSIIIFHKGDEWKNITNNDLIFKRKNLQNDTETKAKALFVWPKETKMLPQLYSVLVRICCNVSHNASALFLPEPLQE